MPGLAAVRLRRVGLERRAGHLDAAEALLKETVEKSKDNPQLHAFYSIKLARFLHKLCKNPSRARTVLQEAIELSPVNDAHFRLPENFFFTVLCYLPRNSIKNHSEQSCRTGQFYNII